MVEIESIVLTYGNDDEAEKMKDILVLYDPTEISAEEMDTLIKANTVSILDETFKDPRIVILREYYGKRLEKMFDTMKEESQKTVKVPALTRRIKAVLGLQIPCFICLFLATTGIIPLFLGHYTLTISIILLIYGLLLLLKQSIANYLYRKKNSGNW